MPTNDCEVRVLFGCLLPSRVGCAQTLNEDITVHRHHSRVCCLRLLKNLNATSYPLHHDQPLSVLPPLFTRLRNATRSWHGIMSTYLRYTTDECGMRVPARVPREHTHRIRTQPQAIAWIRHTTAEPLAHSRWQSKQSCSVAAMVFNPVFFLPPTDSDTSGPRR